MLKSTIKLSALALLTGAFVATAGVAHAGQSVCVKRDKLSKFLENKYSEKPRGLGVSASGKQVFEVYASQAGSWTVVMTMTNGMSCIMASGHSWRDEDKLAYLPKT